MKVDKDYLLNHQYHTADNLQSRIQLHRFGTNKEPFWPWVANKYPFTAGNKILEVGCGPGNFWLDEINTLPQNCDITLTDFSPGMISVAQKNLAHLSQFHFATADIEHLSYSDQSYDAVLAHFMIYHANRPTTALSEINRVLKNTGFAGILLPSHANMEKLFNLIQCENPIQALKFPSETAIDVLPQYFSNITQYVYKDELILTEVDPIIQYVQSFSKMNEKSEVFYSNARQLITTYIKQHGCLSLTTNQYLFIAHK